MAKIELLYTIFLILSIEKWQISSEPITEVECKIAILLDLDRG